MSFLENNPGSKLKEGLNVRKILVAVTIVLIGIFSIGVAENVVNPDTVVEDTYYNIQSLDPAWVSDVGSEEAISQFYDNLIQYDGTSVTRFLPMLSTNVPSVEDGTLLDNGTTYIFHIRQGVYFHNGDLLTPQDVVYSLERAVLFDRAGGPSWMLSEPLLPKIDGKYVDSITQWAVKLAGVKSWDDLFATGTKNPLNASYKQALIDAFNMLAKDFEIKGNDVIIHLPHSYAPFLATLAHYNTLASVLDEQWCAAHKAWDGSANDWWYYHNPTVNDDPLYNIENGTGPFELANWSGGLQITFERFDKYWAEPAKIKYGVINDVAEFTTRKLDLTRGQADVINVLVPYLSQVEGIPGVKVYTHLPTFAIDSIFFTWNVNNQGGNPYLGSGKLDGHGIPPDFFSNKDVRMAFEYLFPYSTYIKQVWLDQALIPNGAVPKGLLGYNPATPTAFNQNLAKAAEYFKKAYNGELWNKGFEFTAVYNTGNTQRQTALEMLQYYAAQVNPKFKIDIASELWATYLNDLIMNRIPMFMIGWTGGPDPYDSAQPFYGSGGAFGAFLGSNYIEWVKEYMDPLLSESMSTTDPQKRAEIFTEMNTIAHDNALFLFTDQQEGVAVMRTWLKGWEYNPMSFLRLNFYSLSK
jgi:peptide/nickel transport system substrate-binding protein